MDDSFYMTLPSNSSMSTYSGNTTARYTTQLREPVKLHGQWSVALVEFHFPQTFFNVVEGQNEISISFMEDKVVVIDLLYVQPGFYATNSNLIKAVNDALAPLSYGKIRVDPNIKRAQLTLDEKFYKQGNAVVLFSPELARQMGYDPVLNAASYSVAGSTMNLNLGKPHHIFVYCDIIDAQIVGDTVAPLLRMVNTNHSKHSFGDEVTASFRTLQYVPVLRREFSTMEIDLRSNTGLPIPFQTGTSSVLLHFKRRS